MTEWKLNRMIFRDPDVTAKHDWDSATKLSRRIFFDTLTWGLPNTLAQRARCKPEDCPGMLKNKKTKTTQFLQLKL
jgi:hypothetical protein